MLSQNLKNNVGFQRMATIAINKGYNVGWIFLVILKSLFFALSLLFFT